MISFQNLNFFYKVYFHLSPACLFRVLTPSLGKCSTSAITKYVVFLSYSSTFQFCDLPLPLSRGTPLLLPAFDSLQHWSAVSALSVCALMSCLLVCFSHGTAIFFRANRIALSRHSDAGGWVMDVGTDDGRVSAGGEVSEEGRRGCCEGGRRKGEGDGWMERVGGRVGGGMDGRVGGWVDEGEWRMTEG